MSAPTQPQPTTPAPTGPIRPWQDPPQVPSKPGPMGPAPRYRQTSTAADLAALLDVRRLAGEYATQVPPLLADPTTEYGRGMVEGLQMMARTVLAALDGPADGPELWPCCGWPAAGGHGDGCLDNWVRG